MTGRSKVWLVVAALFTVGNFAGGVFAAAAGEVLHSATHAALMLLGAYVVWRLAPRPSARDVRRTESDSLLTDRLTNLEQSVDAVAIEIERIGEGQRFVTRMFTDDETPQGSGEKIPEPIENAAPDDPPRGRHH